MDARSTKNRLGPLIWRCRCLKSRKGANVLKNENSGEDLDGLRSLESCSLDKRPAGTSAGDGRQGKIPWNSDSSNPVEYSGEIFMTQSSHLTSGSGNPPQWSRSCWPRQDAARGEPTASHTILLRSEYQSQGIKPLLKGIL